MIRSHVGRACLLGVLVGAAVVAAQTPSPHVAPSFTLAQAGRGQQAYQQHCASCHGDLGGRTGPPLRGAEFRERWFGQPVEPLFSVTKATMPPAAKASLSDDTYADIVAYIIQQNGIIAGDVPLPSDLSALRAMPLPWLPPRGGGEIPGGLALPPTPARSNPLARMTPVTDAMLANPGPGEWLTWRRTWDAHGFSPLNQITKNNVATLRVAWTWTLPAGANEATPLFHDGVLFVQAYGDKVQALDALNGDLLWQYSPHPSAVPPSVKRNMALYGDRLYIATSDLHVVALSIATGKPVWDHRVALPAPSRVSDFSITSGPLVAKGKVMVGTAGSAPGGNFIVGIDLSTGAEAWRVNTIAQVGEPGGDSWNGLAPAQRNGGSVWVTGSYDPSLNLAFFGIAQTYDTGPLRNPIDKPGVTNDALYTDSTVAIDPDTGKMMWHFQHLPNDQWDLDWSLEQLLLKLPGSQKTVLATAGKQAIFDVLDADTGRYRFSMDLGLQDVVTGIDPKTGAKTIDRTKIPGDGKTVTVCPHSAGAKSWNPESYNGTTGKLFVPLNESCMDLVPVEAGGRSMLSTGVRWMLRPRPNSDGKYGRLQAIDLQTRKVVWTTRQRAPWTSGVLATAGGVVFAGSYDRAFAAFDDATGRELWKIRLNDVPNTAPISFQVAGKQYIALSVGSGGGLATSFPMLLPEVKNPRDNGAALYVFALPDR